MEIMLLLKKEVELNIAPMRINSINLSWINQELLEKIKGLGRWGIDDGFRMPIYPNDLLIGGNIVIRYTLEHSYRFGLDQDYTLNIVEEIEKCFQRFKIYFDEEYTEWVVERTGLTGLKTIFRPHEHEDGMYILKNAPFPRKVEAMEIVFMKKRNGKLIAHVREL